MFFKFRPIVSRKSFEAAVSHACHKACENADRLRESMGMLSQLTVHILLEFNNADKMQKSIGTRKSEQTISGQNAGVTRSSRFGAAQTTWRATTRCRAWVPFEDIGLGRTDGMSSIQWPMFHGRYARIRPRPILLGLCQDAFNHLAMLLAIFCAWSITSQVLILPNCCKQNAKNGKHKKMTSS